MQFHSHWLIKSISLSPITPPSSKRTGRAPSLPKAAIGVGSSGSGKQGILTLNNVTFNSNTNYDINISDSATVNINSGTTLSKVRLQSTTAKLNIGARRSGSFEITMDSPSNRTLGTVGAGADISGITVTNDGYTVSNDNGNLVISNDNGAELHFDMNQRSALYHGSTGFLYGTSEINVPSIDLLQGLKPKVMVQKALGGLQHPHRRRDKNAFLKLNRRRTAHRRRAYNHIHADN